ncbi:hypothetical protein GCM10014719_29260 [Planomonospora parontospora subsp. antibiotica]|nr:hypothetical protein GCM10014719_29260 [Planomonospora parontospora subsp. antibiotica]GII16026.1 hypothetical protein Ppa05_27520 [Planomonospora parontospora subsp. antibiotica]
MKWPGTWPWSWLPKNELRKKGASSVSYGIVICSAIGEAGEFPGAARPPCTVRRRAPCAAGRRAPPVAVRRRSPCAAGRRAPACAPYGTGRRRAVRRSADGCGGELPKDRDGFRQCAPICGLGATG